MSGDVVDGFTLHTLLLLFRRLAISASMQLAAFNINII